MSLLVDHNEFSNFVEIMKAKSVEQINVQSHRLLALMSSHRDNNSERYTLVETIMRKYIRMGYAYLDDKYGEEWAAKPDWREKLTIPIPTSVYTGRVGRICSTGSPEQIYQRLRAHSGNGISSSLSGSNE